MENEGIYDIAFLVKLGNYRPPLEGEGGCRPL
jgi:hypothetical protein